MREFSKQFEKKARDPDQCSALPGSPRGLRDACGRIRVRPMGCAPCADQAAVLAGAGAILRCRHPPRTKLPACARRHVQLCSVHRGAGLSLRAVSPRIARTEAARLQGGTSAVALSARNPSPGEVGCNPLQKAGTQETQTIKTIKQLKKVGCDPLSNKKAAFKLEDAVTKTKKILSARPLARPWSERGTSPTCHARSGAYLDAPARLGGETACPGNGISRHDCTSAPSGLTGQGFGDLGCSTRRCACKESFSVLYAGGSYVMSRELHRHTSMLPGTVFHFACS